MEYPDAKDQQIINLLRVNPRTTNKEIANQLDLAESTVGQRVRLMGERNIMRVVAQKHLFSDGYESFCYLLANTSRRSVQEICEEIAQFKDIASVSQGVGNPDVFTAMRAKSLARAHELAAAIGEIKGVDTTELCVVIQVHKYQSALGDLDAPNLQVTDDDSIFFPFSQDGRQSNREVARLLGISEGTVRQRLHKMLKSGVMQFAVVCNPVALRLNTTALVRISTIARHTQNVIEELKPIDSVSLIAEITGMTNVLAVLNTTDPQELGNICDNRLVSIRGVQSMQVQLLVSTAKHLYHYAYFGAMAEVPKRK